MKRVALLGLVVSMVTPGHAQTCSPSITNKMPDSRYQLLNGGDEVKDLKTGLVWQRCSLGQTWDGTHCSGVANRYTWQQALQAAKDVGNGWLLPNIKELASLTVHACSSPAINATIFPDTPVSTVESSTGGAFWSSSPVADTAWAAWSVFSDDGTNYDSNKQLQYYVRPVHVGP